jgi:predicted small metal-binding protein
LTTSAGRRSIESTDGGIPKGVAMSRRVADCRDLPSESNCTLTISGEEAEVVRAAAEHAVSVHGHDPGPELEAGIRQLLKDEVSA